MALTLGFAAMYIQPASMAALTGQQQAGADGTPVWVNTRSHVYHFAGTSYHGRNFYGHTRQGAYMCEADARAAGNRAAFDEHHPSLLNVGEIDALKRARPHFGLHCRAIRCASAI
jgi:hypothetical protein